MEIFVILDKTVWWPALEQFLPGNRLVQGIQAQKDLPRLPEDILKGEGAVPGGFSMPAVRVDWGPAKLWIPPVTSSTCGLEGGFSGMESGVTIHACDPGHQILSYPIVDGRFRR